jgi:hypothetical protein
VDISQSAVDKSQSRISSSAGKLNDVQFSQRPLAVAKGQRYRVRFRARAMPARAMNVGVLKTVPDYRSYGFGGAFNLTEEWEGVHRDL